MRIHTSVFSYLTLLLAVVVFLAPHSVRSQCTAEIEVEASSSLEICDGQSVKLSDVTVNAQQRTWSFGDGSTSTANSPSHLYTLSNPAVNQVYTVTLDVTCIGGFTDQATVDVTVNARPQVDFSVDTTSVCAFSDSVCFTNLSDTGVDYDYSWNFGDLTASTKFAPCYIYNVPGIYDVTLEVTNGQGCFNEHTKTQYMEAIESPSPAFSLNAFSGCAPFTVEVTNETQDPSNNINGWSWSWGDLSSPSSGQSPSGHTYADNDLYEIELTATNTFNCSNSTTLIVESKVTPEATLEVESPVCIGGDAVATYTGDAPGTASYAWTTTGGTVTPSTGQGPNVANFTTSGVQTVELTVTESGCTATGTADVMVLPPPIVVLSSDAGTDTICEKQEVMLSIEPANYAGYDFVVDGSSEYSGPSATFSTDQINDDDQVWVVVSDWLGCTGSSDTLTFTVVGNANISLVASEDSVCLGGAITYTADAGFENYAFYDRSALVQEGSATTLDYSGATNGSEISVVGSISGCEFESATKLTPEVLEPLATPVLNCGTTTESEITFVWDELDDADSYEIQLEGGAFIATTGNLSHDLTGLGIDSAVTAVIRAFGGSQCADTVQSTAVTCSTIDCDPISFEISGPAETCKGQPVTIQAVNLSTNNFSLNWDGNGAGTATEFDLDVVTNWSLQVELVDSNQLACPAYVQTYLLTVTDTPNVALAISENDSEICLGEYVEFTATPTGLDQYDFRINNTTIQSSTANVYGSTELENGDEISVVATKNGCSSAVNAGVTITEVVQEPLSVAQPICGTTTLSSVEFVWNSVDGADSYQISVDGSVFEAPSSGSTGLVHVLSGLNPGDEHSIVVEALGPPPCDESGLSLPATCFVQECSPITFDKTADQEVCQGDEVTVTLSNLSTADYSISWGGGPFESNLSTQLVANEDTNVFVQMIDSTQLECPMTTQFITVRVTPQPTTTLVSSAASDTICSSASLVFTAAPGGYDQYDFIRGFQVLQSSSSNLFNAVSWEDGDSLFVIGTNGTCTGDSSNVITTTVFDELTIPQLNCGITTDTSVTFVWDPIVGADGYEVSVNGVGFTTASSGTMGLEHFIGGLTGGDNVTIFARALGEEPCGNSDVSAPLTCTAIPCIPPTFDKIGPQEVCEGEAVTVSISNVATNGGSFEVSWDGVPSAQTLFQTFNLNANLSYEVSVADPDEPVNCPATTKYIDLTANLIPVVTLVTNAVNDSICDDQPLTISAEPQGYDLYEFTLGTQLMQANGNHAFYHFNWQEDDSLTVVPTHRNCVGSAVSFTTDVYQGTALTTPQVNCGITTSSGITFQWDAIDGSTGYEVNVDGNGFEEPSSGLLGTSHSLTGLDSGSVASIQIRAMGASPCSDTELSLQTFCKVIDCPELNYNISAAQSVCEGDYWAITLTDLTVADYGVSWNNAAFGSNVSYAYRPQQDTVVSVRVSNNQRPACPITTKSAAVELVVPPSATLVTNDADHVICEGDAVNFTAGPLGQFDYSFYSGFELLQSGTDHTIQLNDLENGEQVDVVVSLLGCSDTAVGTAFNVSHSLLSPQPNCSTTTNSDVIITWDLVTDATGYEISVDGGSYVVPTGASSHSITGLNSADGVTAIVRALGDPPCGDTEGVFTASCSAEPCEAVDFDMVPEVVACAGEEVNLSISNLSSTSGNNDFTITWNSDAGAATSNYAYGAGVDTTIAVSVVDNTNPATCAATTKYFIFDIEELPLVTALNLLSSGAECEGDSLVFDASPKRFDNYEFFYNGLTSIQSSPNPVLIVDTLSNGAEITVLATNNGCAPSTSTSSGAVALNSKPDVTLVTSSGSTVSCFGQSVTFQASTGLDRYQFYNGSLLLQDGASNTLTSNLITDGDSIHVIAQNSDGCQNAELSTGSFVEVEVLDLPTVTLSSSTNGTICENQGVVFTASPAGLANYVFAVEGTEAQNSASNTATITTIDDGQRVSVTGANSGGCVSEASFSVSYPVKPLPVLTTTGDTAYICQNDTVALSAVDLVNGSATSISWQGGSVVGSTFEFAPSSPTLISVTGTLDGCSITSTIQVEIDTDFPVLSVGAIQTVCLGDSIALSVSGAKTYAWDNANEIADRTSNTPYAIPADTAARAYRVVGTNDGCSTEGFAFVLIDRCLTDLPEDTPDAISPNGDGKNDTWNIKDIDYFSSSAMTIYNRWGNVVFESAPFLGWDGTSTKGKMLPDGTYYYVLDLGNQAQPHTGYILIHR